MATVMNSHKSASEQKQQTTLKRSRSRPSSHETQTKKQCTSQDHDQDCDTWSLAASVGDDLGSLDDVPVAEFDHEDHQKESQMTHS